MRRSKGDMASPGYLILILGAFYISICSAGPVPYLTHLGLGLTEETCALGDVVYRPGDRFPGEGPCEHCTCSNGNVNCVKENCEPRPGCKALHSPDRCCPTYQCECEQGGRIYGNGEKLVDPRNPCHVCYCQGGEVVCRRIACFVRDDCQPRLVPGRCCPEYENCPVRDGTPLPGVASSAPSLPFVENVKASLNSSQPSEPKITIKEITPVSEIPVTTDVKINREILPSPSIEVAEYSSSKSPLIPREVTSEKSTSSMEKTSQFDTPVAKDGLSSVSTITAESSESSLKQLSEVNTTNNTPPSRKILSTEDNSDVEVSSSKIPHVVQMMGVPPVLDTSHLTTKAPIIEEEDLDHNPAFPPIPDDLFLVLSNHEEEAMPEQTLDSDHVRIDQENIKATSTQMSTEEPIFKESSATTVSYISDVATITREGINISAETSTIKDVSTSTQSSITKQNPAMLNMRSVIPTEILNAPSLISDDITGDILDVTDSSITAMIDNESPTEISSGDVSTKYTDNSENQSNAGVAFSNASSKDSLTFELEPKSSEVLQPTNVMDETTNNLSKSTEILSETEFSSIPIETSDQNPHELSDKENKDPFTASTTNQVNIESSTFKPFINEDEGITVSRAFEKEYQSFENGETTEFILTSFGSEESTTDAVELIKVSSDSEKSSPIIESRKKNSNVLTDLINLVGDVASISDHTETPISEHQTSIPTTISDSEELIPVNVAAGYKSKNKNWNLNSITEVPVKQKVPMQVNKQNVVEIEGDESDAITDSPLPNNRFEPTTRLPIIDNVSDIDNKTEIADKKDIEIITQSYVPTLNRRPTKVIMEKNDEKPLSEESSDAVVTPSDDKVDANVSSSNDATNPPEPKTSSSESEERSMEQSPELSSTTAQ